MKNNKKYIIRRIIFLAIIVTLLLTIVHFIKIQCKTEEVFYNDTNLYTVKKGDTIWEIVEKEYEEQNIDIRIIVNDIIEINNLKNEFIKPGQVLQLPVY